jgi:hypothetical protein
MDNWTIAKIYELIHSIIPLSINDEVDFWDRMETGKPLNEYELLALKQVAHILDIASELGVVELKTTDMLGTILGTSKKKNPKPISKKTKEQPTYIKEVVCVGRGNSGWSDESHAQYMPRDTSYDGYDDGMGY